MSQYKSALRAQQPSSQPDDYKYRPQARQLQEMFPSWSNDDLQSLLNEVGGDVQVAATRITDGVAEQWGSVTRKKDKKGPTSGHASKDSVSGRGDFRGGARGGRGGRAVARGGARGRGGVPRTVSTNGHISRTSSPKPSTLLGDTSLVAPDHTEPATVDSATTRTQEKSSASEVTDPAKTQGPALSSDSAVNGTSTHAPAKSAPKLPTTQKLSWAQIARPQEKPIPTPAVPVHVPSQQPTVPLPPPLTTAHTVQPQPPARPEFSELAPPPGAVEAESSGWEEPTTVQPPSWDDEPAGKPAVSVTESSWPPSSESVEQPKAEPIPELVTEEKPEVLSPMIPQSHLSAEPVVEPRPLPAVSVQPSVAATPSPKLTTRPSSVAHRARHKNTDQPVVMPSSFGYGLEKIGMQFGSLNLNGDNEPEPPAETEIPAPKAPTPPPPREATPPPPPPATAPASTSALASTLFQQQQQQPSQNLQQPSHATPHHAPTQPTTSTHHNPQSISQVSHAQSIPSTNSVATSSPLQHYTPQATSQAQHALPSTHHQAQPHQSHHHQYNQHGLSNHVDSPQQATSIPQTQATSHASYFRQTEAAASSPYFHTPTPPTTQAQENSYSSFGQLAGQSQHQQSTHLSNFSGTEYGYGDNQRGFYESYTQQSAFGGRTVLGHEDVKGLPTTQQPSATATHPPTSAQTTQQHPSSQAAQPQSASSQAPQQGYAPQPQPVPYYYNPYPQNQYYGSPYNSGYGVPQPFVKYPTIFQPGPPGPGSAPTPGGKQPGSNVGVGVSVQPQANPYNQGLYQQGGYDDYPQHPVHSQHQQHSHSHSLGLGQGVGSGEYGKQLYGSSGQGTIQGFMSLGQGGAGSGGVPPSNASGPRGGNSPENAYKPYSNKDVGVNAGGRAVQQAGGPVQQQQGQGQAQGGQGPQTQAFYGGNRFGSGAGVPPQAHHQQAGPQGHLGYPQSGSEGGFYPYQPRQQQGYW